MWPILAGGDGFGCRLCIYTEFLGEMGDAGPLMDFDMDVDDFFSILSEPPASSNQVKAPQEESNEEQQLNIGTPPMGSDSCNLRLHYDPYLDKEHDIFLSDTLNPNSCESLQSEQLRGTTPSSSSDIFQDLESVSGLDELGTMYPVDSERPQQRDGSVLASEWIPTANSGNNTVTHISTVNSLDAERNSKMFGFIDENLPLLELKSSANNVNESISGRSFEDSAARELVDLTQTDSSDEEIEITTSQFGLASKPDSVNADVRRKLPDWGKPSNKNFVKKGSWKIPQKNSNLKNISDWNSGKMPTNAEETGIVGLRLQGASGSGLGGKFTERKQNTGNPYHHAEFSVEHKPQVEEWMGRSFEPKLQVSEEWPFGSFEQKPQIKEEWSSGNFEPKAQIKEEWSGGSFPFNWKSDSINLEDEVIEKPNLKDIAYWNGDSDTEDKPDYNNTGRHLPATLGCARSLNAVGSNVPPWTKSEDETLTFRAVLQYQDLPTVESTPDDGLLAVPLLKHQRIALAWMVLQETKSTHCAGGILADDQGLGKTVSVIALILKERPSYRSLQEDSDQVKVETSAVNLDEDDVEATCLERKRSNYDANDIAMEEYINGKENTFSMKKGRPSAGTLVVCPTSVLKQWAQEIRDKVTAKANLSVLVYHGSNRTKDPDELAKHDVVLTTYSIVSMEVPKQDLGDDYEEVERNPDDSGLMDSFTHKKKKKTSETAKKTKSRKGENGSSEPIARPLARVGWFRVVLDEAQSIKNHRTQVARACWGLRSKRRWCLSGTPIQNSIDDLFSYFRFLKYDPYAVYKSFTSRIKLPISRNPVQGYQKLQAVLKTVMLRRTKGSTIDGEPIIVLPKKTITLKKVEFSAEERDFYHFLEVQSQAQFKVYAAAGTVKKNYVNILLMLLRLRQACDHPLLVKSCLSISTWRSSAEAARKLPREKQIELINHLEGSLALCGICNDAPEEAVVTVCGHVFCNQCILDHLTQSDDTICPTPGCKCHLKDDSVFSLTALKHCTSDDNANDEITPSLGGVSELDLKFDEPGFKSSKIKAAMETLEALPKICTSVSSNSSVSNINKDSGFPGIKAEVIVQENTAEMSDSDNRSQDAEPSLKKQIIETSEKAIVFSQWTSMLDLLEVPLKKSCIQYRRLDGTMSVLARDKAVNDFKTLPEVTVMIMSLKAASLGLNMVAACHVLLLDLWWNPTTEDQAIDRAHRIGQMRPVVVSRFTVQDTVEDRILALQERKREMVASAFGEDGAAGRQTRLTEEDLRYLFMV